MKHFKRRAPRVSCTRVEPVPGWVLYLAASDRGLCRLNFAGEPEAFRQELEARGYLVQWEDPPRHPVLRQAAQQLVQYVQGKRRQFTVRLDLEGTAFQLCVWQALQAIPYGETRSYREIAEAIGHPRSWRAVARANRDNPLPIFVPCHRVIRQNGALGGYRPGLEFKRRLLELERRFKRA